MPRSNLAMEIMASGMIHRDLGDGAVDYFPYAGGAT
jgi:hypothetical protein